MSKLRSMIDSIKSAGGKVADPFHALQKEKKLGPVLHAEVLAALRQLQDKYPEVKKVLKEAHGYAVVPDMGRASLVLGGAYGLGEVFEGERVIGYAAVVELSLGVQVGGTNFHELVVFHDEGALKRFKSGKWALAADANIAIVKAGAQAQHGFGGGSSIWAFSDGGMILDLALGAQKFIYKPAAFGRLRTSEGGVVDENEGAGEGQEQQAERQDQQQTEAKSEGDGRAARKQEQPRPE